MVVVTTGEIEEYISKSIGMDLSKVFDQYLRDYLFLNMK